MEIVHGIAKAKLLDMVSMKVVKAIITDRSGQEVVLPNKLEKFMKKRLSKNLGYDFSDAWNNKLELFCSDVEFTYVALENFGAIAIRNKMEEKYNKGMGITIAKGRAMRAAGLLEKSIYKNSSMYNFSQSPFVAEF